MAKKKVPGGHMVGMIPEEKPEQEKPEQEKPKTEQEKPKPKTEQGK